MVSIYGHQTSKRYTRISTERQEESTSTIISKATGISQPRVTELWKDWLSLGLGESISASGGSRFKKSFELKMFGISVSEAKQKQSEQESIAPSWGKISDGQ